MSAKFLPKDVCEDDDSGTGLRLAFFCTGCVYRYGGVCRLLVMQVFRDQGYVASYKEL